MMNARHHSRQSFFRAPGGALPTGGRVTLRVQIDAQLVSPRVVLRVFLTGGLEESRDIVMEDLGGHGLWRTYSAGMEIPREPCLIWYHFRIESGGQVAYCGNATDALGGYGHVYTHDPRSFQITVYDAAFAPPDWMRESVMYQIFPDRFYDGCAGKLLAARQDIRRHKRWSEAPAYITDNMKPNEVNTDFFGGNLAGVEKKLKYLKDLGVGVIYLNPIFRAHSNHKYDTGDYNQVDPTFGDEEALRKLCAAARKRGIRVILDGVFSHTGDDSVYFNRYGHYDDVGAYQSVDSPYYTWYTFHKHPDDYVSWWGVPSLPEVNEMHPDYLDFIITGQNAVVAKWIDLGTSGWRLDVADELPDEFIEMMRRRVKDTQGEACLIGEVWEDATNKIAYGRPRRYALGRGLDSVMNYPLREALISFLLEKESAARTRRKLLSQKENYPPPMYYALMNMLGSHDRPRIVNMLVGRDEVNLPPEKRGAYRLSDEEYELGCARVRLMLQVICALPGMPSVYYGDEAGLQGLHDPFCRFPFPWGKEDKAQQAFFRETIAMRRKIPCLQGGWVDVFAPHEDVLCVVRQNAGGRDALGKPADEGLALVAVNRSQEESRKVVLDLSTTGKETLFSASGEEYDCPSGILTLELAPLSCVMLLDKATQVGLVPKEK